MIIMQYKITSGEEDLQDGRGVRSGDHPPPHKYIKNTSTCGTTPTEWEKIFANNVTDKGLICKT